MSPTYITGNYFLYKRISVFLTALVKIIHRFNEHRVNENMNSYRYIPLHIILQQQAVVILVTIIRMSYNKTTTNVQTTVQKCMTGSSPESIECNPNFPTLLLLNVLVCLV
jgi:hypothetical protein